VPGPLGPLGPLGRRALGVGSRVARSLAGPGRGAALPSLASRLQAGALGRWMTALPFRHVAWGVESLGWLGRQAAGVRGGCGAGVAGPSGVRPPGCEVAALLRCRDVRQDGALTDDRSADRSAGTLTPLGRMPHRRRLPRRPDFPDWLTAARPTSSFHVKRREYEPPNQD
jgi:hypothetical protein